jgi:uncharacterized protein (DUF1778 family)
MVTKTRSDKRTHGEAKSERLNARLTPQAKELVQEAAALSGRSVTDFVSEAAQEKALATIRDHRMWTLNAEQSLAFARAVLDPPEPTATQRAYAADYWAAVAAESSSAGGAIADAEPRDDAQDAAQPE